MFVLTVVAALLAAALLLPTISDLWSAIVALGRSRASTPAAPDTSRLLFIVPAHNEALLIEQCVRSLQRLDYPRDAFHVIVIADNCSDATSPIARAAGAECLERSDRTRTGKPYAIAWALDRVPLADFDAITIIDADTVVDRGFAKGLAAAAPLRNKAVQGYNGVSNPNENAVTRMAAVFADAKCRFAYGLKGRAGLNVPVRLGGCLGTSVITEHGWQAFSIGEDWELYAQLTAWGVPIEGTSAARVYAQEARSFRQSGPQRRRWTAGKYSVLRQTAGIVLRSRHISAHQKLDVVAELSAPGPVVHAAAAVLACAAVMTMDLPGAAILVAMFAAGTARHVIYASAALLVQPHPVRSALAFLFLPIYALWRVPVEFAALRLRGNGAWVRTERHESDAIV